jgi:hypothetical protein
MLANLGCSIVFGANATVNIDSAVIDQNNTVKLSCTVNNPSDNQRVVVMVAEINDGVINYNNIIYINQFDYYEGFNTTFKINISDVNYYAVVVGGSNITNSAYAAITMLDEAIPEITTEATTANTTADTTVSTETTTVVSYTNTNNGGGGGGSIKSTTTTTTTETTTVTTTEATTETTTAEQSTETTTADVSVLSAGKNVSVSIGSSKVIIGDDSYDMAVAPYIQESSSSTMVPLRFVALAISGDNVTDADNSSLVSWDSDTKTATITTKYRTIAFTAGSNEMVINGTPSVMDNSVQSEITDGRMFIPFRAMGKALGVDVEWIADTKTAVYKVK